MADLQAPPLPWQALTAAAGLPLAAPVPPGPAGLELDVAALVADLAAAEAATEAAAEAATERTAEAATERAAGEARTFVAHMPGWCSIPLVGMDGPDGGAGVACPALAHTPAIAALLDRLGPAVIQADLIRYAPGWVLDWHYDPLAPRLAATRLLLPLRSGPGAVTWMSHERHHLAVGALWTGDFTFPHLVRNDAAERVVLTVDVLMDSRTRALIPPPLLAEPERRHALAQEAANLMLAWRAAG